MSSTPNYEYNHGYDEMFVHNNDSDDTFDYYMSIEDKDSYFQPINKKNTDRFRVHGKYTSTSHIGNTPTEFYCDMKDAMTLRSGKKINYLGESLMYREASEVLSTWNGDVNNRCLSTKKIIWFLENYHHIISTSYEWINFYKIAYIKICEITKEIKKSTQPIYINRKLAPAFDENGVKYNVICPNENTEENDKMRRRGKNTTIFCNCHYIVTKNGKAIEQRGHHQDEYMRKLKKLKNMYSAPHRETINSTTFKFVNNKTNMDCSSIIFSFL